MKTCVVYLNFVVLKDSLTMVKWKWKNKLALLRGMENVRGYPSKWKHSVLGSCFPILDSHT